AAAARAHPDGYTLLLTTVANTINQALRPRPGAHIVENFDHVSLLGYGASVLIVASDSDIETLADLRHKAQAAPGKLIYGSGGIGTSGHLAMELMQLRANIALTHVPYKAGSQAVLDLLGGDLDVMFTNLDVALPHIQSGRVRALGVTTRERNPQVPELPTIAEQDIAGFEVTTWGGISVPAGTPPERIRVLDEAIRRAVEGEFRKKQEAVGLLVRPMASEAFGRFVRDETAKWQEVVEQAGVRLD
ncbi:MAG TPA: tripartite tricarboxylate transporter substrate binding protein, partial [Burkholderiaceae bacterium]|nr:tripartite tricarboxylate transporter substrate binding protein [Burkholderiaceae bacterium]